MRLVHTLRALRTVTTREVLKFVQQRGRLLSALVRPLMWLAVFAAGFYNVFGVSIIPPYKTYITYQVYIVPGLLGIILLFHGMQSSLSMVYDREMGVMRLLLTARYRAGRCWRASWWRGRHCRSSPATCSSPSAFRSM